MTLYVTKINYFIYIIYSDSYPWLNPWNDTHIVMCMCILALFWNEVLYISPDPEKFCDPQGLTVLGFKLFREIPIYSYLLSKLDDGEAQRGHGETRLSFGSISWRSFVGCSCLEKWSFQIHCKLPFSFHGPQKPSECLWGGRKQSLFPSRFEGFVIRIPMFSPMLYTHKTAPCGSH